MVSNGTILVYEEIDWVAIKVTYIIAYINIKMGYSLNCNPLYYMEPADRIELSTY